MSVGWRENKKVYLLLKRYYQNIVLGLCGWTVNDQPGATAFVLKGSCMTRHYLWPRLKQLWKNGNSEIQHLYPASKERSESISIVGKGFTNLMVGAGVNFNVLTSHPAIFFKNCFLPLVVCGFFLPSFRYLMILSVTEKLLCIWSRVP